MIQVYFASKLSNKDLFFKIREEWKEVHFVSRWPFLVGKISDNNPHECAKFWQDDLADVQRADVILVFAEKHDVLRGALVEAGAALAQGKLVIAVGDNEGYGSWQYHPKVRRVDTLETARALLKLKAIGGQKDGY